MFKDKLSIILISIIFALLLIISYLVYLVFFAKEKDKDTDDNSEKVTNFIECEKAGGIVMESYPRQCKSPNGDMFVEIIDIDEQAEESEEVVEGDSTTVEEKEAVLALYLFDSVKFDIPNNSDYLTRVFRSTTRKDVATFLIEEIIKGPSSVELTKDFKPTFGVNNQIWFVTTSNCNSKDFKITINNKIATIKFCRDTMLAGDMSGYIVTECIR